MMTTTKAFRKIQNKPKKQSYRPPTIDPTTALCKAMSEPNTATLTAKNQPSVPHHQNTELKPLEDKYQKQRTLNKLVNKSLLNNAQNDN